MSRRKKRQPYRYPYLKLLFPRCHLDRLPRDVNKFIQTTAPYIDYLFPDGLPEDFGDGVVDDTTRDLRRAAQDYGISATNLLGWLDVTRHNVYSMGCSKSPVSRARVRLATVAELCHRGLDDEAVGELEKMAAGPLWPYIRDLLELRKNGRGESARLA